MCEYMIHMFIRNTSIIKRSFYGIYISNWKIEKGGDYGCAVNYVFGWMCPCGYSCVQQRLWCRNQHQYKMKLLDQPYNHCSMHGVWCWFQKYISCLCIWKFSFRNWPFFLVHNLCTTTVAVTAVSLNIRCPWSYVQSATKRIGAEIPQITNNTAIQIQKKVCIKIPKLWSVILSSSLDLVGSEQNAFNREQNGIVCMQCM